MPGRRWRRTLSSRACGRHRKSPHRSSGVENRPWCYAIARKTPGQAAQIQASGSSGSWQAAEAAAAARSKRCLGQVGTDPALEENAPASAGHVMGVFAHLDQRVQVARRTLVGEPTRPPLRRRHRRAAAAAAGYRGRVQRRSSHPGRWQQPQRRSTAATAAFDSFDLAGEHQLLDPPLDCVLREMTVSISRGVVGMPVQRCGRALLMMPIPPPAH